MNKLMLCRICLAEDVRMYCIVDTTLQGTYEMLTAVPFETKDCRPLQICYLCYAKLRNCYQLQASCLESEEILSQMLQSNELIPAPLQDKNTFKIVHPVVHLNIPPANVRVHNDDASNEDTIDNIKIEPFDLSEDVQVKEEYSEATTEFKDQITSVKTVRIVLDKLDSDSNKTSVPVPVKPVLVKIAENTKSIMSSNLRKHMKLHQSKNIVMKICRTPKHTKKDDLDIQIGEKKYKCYICLKIFSRKCDLTRHKQRHNTEKPYACYLCDKSFYQKKHLDSHICIHTGDKIFKCDICGKCFRYKSDLYYHMCVHLGRKPYKCDLCNKHFYRRNHLNQHIQIHTGEKPFKCHLCEKCFALKFYLTNHLRTHTGEKRYYCDRCGKAFATMANLSRHNLIHTGEKPYQCDICEKRFNQKENLHTHTRKHAKNHIGKRVQRPRILKKK